MLKPLPFRASGDTRGLLIGGIFMDPKSAQTATTVVMLTFLLVGKLLGRGRPAAAACLLQAGEAARGAYDSLSHWW